MIVAVSSTLISQQLISTLQAYASESSPYDSGYDHGCDDAGRSESDKYINQPERGPSFHTEEFMSGYYDGLNRCGDSGSDESPRDDGGQDGRSRGDLIEDLCNFAETNPAAAAGIAVLLGYPGLDAAVRGLCTFR
jgi:hypothetical protein